MSYNQIAQKKYNEKCKRYTIKYTPDELEIIPQIEKALQESGMTANAWMKQAIKEKLERDTLE